MIHIFVSRRLFTIRWVCYVDKAHRLHIEPIASFLPRKWRQSGFTNDVTIRARAFSLRYAVHDNVGLLSSDGGANIASW